jgi:L-alanine-DL-glutamate epimerase-like enolase superfamily enzyme
VAATVEYSASCSNFMIMEHSHHANAFKNAITAENYDPVNGFFEVSDRPGLGIEIDQSLVEKYLVS